jgi:hypothetical protein
MFSSKKEQVLESLRQSNWVFVQIDDFAYRIGLNSRELKWVLYCLKVQGKVEIACDSTGTPGARGRVRLTRNRCSESLGLRQLHCDPLAALQITLPNAGAGTSIAHERSGDCNHAAQLASWLIGYCRSRETDTVSTREVQRKGPGAMRNSEMLNSALYELVGLGRVKLVLDGRKKAVSVSAELLAAAVT